MLTNENHPSAINFTRCDQHQTHHQIHRQTCWKVSKQCGYLTPGTLRRRVQPCCQIITCSDFCWTNFASLNHALHSTSSWTQSPPSKRSPKFRESNLCEVRWVIAEHQHPEHNECLLFSRSSNREWVLNSNRSFESLRLRYVDLTASHLFRVAVAKPVW